MCANGYDLRMSKPQARWAMGFSTIFHGKRMVNSPTAHTPGGALLKRLLASTLLRSQTLAVVRVEVYPHSTNGPETSRLCVPARVAVFDIDGVESGLHLWPLSPEVPDMRVVRSPPSAKPTRKRPDGDSRYTSRQYRSV